MFGIGLPEMIVIFAVALIVVGPDKLPGLARSLAKGLMELKQTLNQVKDSISKEDESLDSVQKDLRKTADELRQTMIDVDPSDWRPAGGPNRKPTDEEIIDTGPETLAIDAEDYPPPSAAAGEPDASDRHGDDEGPVTASNQDQPAKPVDPPR